MAEAVNQTRELVFCHACDNEWFRSEHGLECPDCHSDCVEIIDPGSDPREQNTADDELPSLIDAGEQPPPYASRSNTWGANLPASGIWGTNSGGAPDPDEDDIQHVQYGGRSGGGGMSYHSTTYIRNGPGGATHTTRVVNGSDMFPQLLSNILGVMQPQAAHPQQRSPPQGSEVLPQQEDMRSPLQEGPFRTAEPPRLRSTVQITHNFGGRGTQTRMQQQNVATDDIMGIFSNILQGIGGGHGAFPPNHPGQAGQPGQPPNPFAFLAQMLDPANARAGDAVFTNEAMDRVISQLMEQHQGSNAPGPATEGAIAALPRRKITKTDLGENGLADCSICMESVEVGSEVTELPCKHWFHNDCVSPWLHEHDTCPQCRRGITPQEGDQNAPRATGQAPRYWNMSETDFRAEAGLPSQGDNHATPQQPGSSHLSPSSNHEPSSDRSTREHSRRRSRSGEGRSFSSGISNLMGRFRSGGSSNGGSADGGHPDPRGH